MSETRKWMCKNIPDFDQCNPHWADELEALLNKHAAYCSQADAEKITRLEAKNKEQLEELERWRSEHDPCPFQVRMEIAEDRCKVLEAAEDDIVAAVKKAGKS
jgi:dsDNA-binding SOS-regulon protein